ncbi:MAG: hypothetical protein HYX87_04170 [Chloroflexi bacterium]|nr:hypothetical protein [Chloroflexota bacterium]
MGQRDDRMVGANTGGDPAEADQAISQFATEAASLTASGKIGAEIVNQKNELLWKITAQIDETKLNLEQLEETQKNLKKHLAQLQSLKKILST